MLDIYLEMAKGEQEEVHQANVVSYFKSLTLEKKHGTTGAIEMKQGAVYIGDILKIDIINPRSKTIFKVTWTPVE